MSKVRKIAEITPNLPFSEFNFYELYRETFEKSELGRKKETEILYIFFGIHTANAVQLAERLMEQELAEVA